MVRREDGLADSPITLLVADVDLSNAEPEALEINRYWERSGRKLGQEEFRVSEAAASEVVRRWTDGATIVGAQPWFDTECLEAMVNRHGYSAAWHYRKVCVESMTAGHLRREAASLVNSALALGITVDHAAVHSAMGDVLTVRAIYDQVMEISAATPE